MTEAQAFRIIAKRFVAGQETRGICKALWTLPHSVTIATTDKMHTRISKYVGHSGYAYDKPDEIFNGFTRNDEGRALACLWMALEAENEARTARGEG